MAVTLPVSRARAREVDAIVGEIAEQMADGRWVTGRSHRELATREGVSVSRVEDWSSQAGRLLRALSASDREDLRARNAARLDHIVEQALARQAVVPQRDGDALVVPQPDLKAAVSAIAEQGKLLGLNAPEQHQHAHVVAAYEKLDRPAKRAQLVEAIAVLQADLAALDAEEERNGVALATVIHVGGDDE